jgi:hypothetical protein
MVEFLTIRPSLLLPKLVSQVADAQGVEHGDPFRLRPYQSRFGYQHVPILGKARNAAADRRGDYFPSGARRQAMPI